MKKILTALLIVNFSAFWAGAEFIETAADSTVAGNESGGLVAGGTKNINLGLHHLSLGFLGYYKSTSGDFEFLDFDASVATPNFLNYRYSLSKNVDFAIDMHVWGNEINYYGAKVTTTAGGLGIGTRFTQNDLSKFIFPYIQGNVYVMVEGIAFEYGGYKEDFSENGVGFGLNAGVELKLWEHISVPLEVMYLYGKPADDVSGYGVCAGVSLNWGKIQDLETPSEKGYIEYVPRLHAVSADSALPMSTEGTVGLEDGQEKAAGTETTLTAVEPTSVDHLTQTVQGKGKNNAISAGVLGVNKALSHDFTSLGDAASAGYSYFFTYRQTVHKKLDVVMDLHTWTSDFDYSGSKVSVLVTGVGLGLRYNFIEPQKKIIPYIQITALNVTEQVEHTEDSDYTKAKARNFGFCINAGLDLKVNDFLSIPIDSYLLSARPADNVTSLGATTGLSLHW